MNTNEYGFDADLKNEWMSEEMTSQNFSEKFLQKKYFPISNQMVLEAIHCEKFLLDRTNMTALEENYSYLANNARSQSFSFTSDYDLCESDVRFYASSNRDEVQIYAIHTYKGSNGAFSISQYLLPNGKLNDAVFIARLCSHGKNGQMHLNWNGEQIAGNVSHAHIMTEYFQEKEKTNANGNMLQLATRMAYADAIPLPSLENIAKCANFAHDFFNLAPPEFAISLASLPSKKATELKKAIEQTKQNYHLSHPKKRDKIALPKMNQNSTVQKSTKTKHAYLSK